MRKYGLYMRKFTLKAKEKSLPTWRMKRVGQANMDASESSQPAVLSHLVFTLPTSRCSSLWKLLVSATHHGWLGLSR